MNHIRWKRFRLIAFLSIYLPAAAAAGEKGKSKPATRPAKIKITISRKTTYVLGPINADGTINYVAAINKMSSKGVTPQNNAAIPLIHAVGPEKIPKQVRVQTFKILKMRLLPEKGEYFQDLEDYEQVRAEKAGTESDSDAVEQQLGRVMRAPWSAKDYPLVADWLKVNEKPLVLAVAASKRPRYYIPLLSLSKPPWMLDAFLPPICQFRRMSIALTVRAMLKAGSGDIAAARADLLVIHRLARLIGQGPMLIDRLVAASIETTACDAASVLATSGRLAAAQAKAHLADLQSLPALPGVTEAIDNTERFFGLDSVMLLSRQGMAGLKALTGTIDQQAEKLPEQRLSLDWDMFLVKVNQLYDRQMVVFRKNSFAERKQASAAYERSLTELKIKVGKIGPKGWKQLERKIKTLSGKPTAARREVSETMADLLVSIIMPNISRASEIHDRVVMQRRLTEVALALAVCKAERRRYPRNLVELKPKYLKEIPDDLFTEKPLRYKRTDKGYLLYSVGPNMKDDGGRGRDEGKDCDDIVVKTK